MEFTLEFGSRDPSTELMQFICLVTDVLQPRQREDGSGKQEGWIALSREKQNLSG